MKCETIDTRPTLSNLWSVYKDDVTHLFSGLDHKSDNEVLFITSITENFPEIALRHFNYQ